DAVEVSFGEHHHAQTNEREQREPGDDELDRLQRRERARGRSRICGKSRGRDGDGASLPLDRTAVDDDASARGECVARDQRVPVNANVATKGDDVAAHGAEDVEVSVCNRNWSVHPRAGGDGSITPGEVLGVGEVGLASCAMLDDLLLELSRIM